LDLGNFSKGLSFIFFLIRLIGRKKSGRIKKKCEKKMKNGIKNMSIGYYVSRPIPFGPPKWEVKPFKGRKKLSYVYDWTI
jgi:hypothetical protein